MATTFKALRQYEKIGLIILGVVVMVAFTMGDFFSYSRQSGKDPSGATLVTWNGGSLTKGQIEQIGNDHRSVIDVETEILEQIAKDKKNPAQPKVQPIMQVSGSGELINRYIFSTYASNIGLQVDDEAVRTFLKKLSGDRMGMREIRKVLDDVVGDSPEARTRFFAWMRRELASKAVERMIVSAQLGVAPDSAWEQFRMMMQRAEIQFIALPTKNYMDKVKDKPSAAQLKSLYEELKGRYRLVDVPDNGVRRPEEVAFEWVKADINTFLQEEKKNITDEQVKEYYEKNKNQYKKPRKPPVQPPKTESENKNETETKPEEVADPAKSEPKPEGDKPATAEKADAPAEPKPEAGALQGKKDPESPEKPAEDPTEKPAEKPSSEPKSEEPAEKPKDGDDSQSLVSLISQEPSAKNQEPAKPASDPPPAQEQKPEPTKENPPPPEKEQEKAPASEPAGQEKSAESETKPTDEKIVQETPATEEDEFKPLEEVADNIRTDLASKPAEDRFNKALKDAETELRALWKKVNLGEGKIDQAALKKFDLTAFAAKHSLTSGNIPLNPPDVVRDKYELGKFGNFLAEAYFSDKPMLYEPRLIKANQFLTNEAYIYWRTEQKDEYEPTFEECEEELKNADRYRKAKELARQDAKDKAAKVKSGQSLKEAFPMENVLVTGQFSYKTPFSPRVGEIPEIPGAGEAFLGEVFKLKAGHVKEIPLADESQFYVVYLTKYAFSDKELRDQFANFPIIAELAQAADAQSMERRNALGREFLDSLDVKVVGQENAAAEE
jgi:hypothetical protein